MSSLSHLATTAATSTQETVNTIDQILDRGVAGILAAAIIVLVVSGARGWWIWKWTHDEVVAHKDHQIKLLSDERDYYREFAMRTLNVGEALAARRRPEP